MSRVLILGGNFAGLSAARALSSPLDVTVLDPGPAVEFLPNIHELVSGVKRPADLRLPRERLIRGAGHRFLPEAAEKLDPDTRRVVTRSGRELSYDAAVLAMGGVEATFGVPGVERYAYGFKNVDHCAAIGARLRRLVDGDGSVPVVVVGGGIEGVEATGEILRAHRHRDSLRLTLVEAGPRLMASAPEAVDRAIRAQLAAHDVQVICEDPVAEVGADQVRLRSGTVVPSALTIWTGGVRPPDVLAAWGLADPGRWAPVHDTLQHREYPELFVAGDLAGFPQMLEKQAYHAMDMGTHAAGNLGRWLRGRPLRPFRPSGKPTLVAMGDLDAFLIQGERAFAGRGLGAAKEAVYQLVMAQLNPPRPGSGSTRRLLRRLPRSWRPLAAQHGPVLRGALGMGKLRKL